MKIKVDSKGKIIGYVLIGDNPDYDTAVDINTLPEDFFDNFSPEYYLFVNGNVVTNPTTLHQLSQHQIVGQRLNKNH